MHELLSSLDDFPRIAQVKLKPQDLAVSRAEAFGMQFLDRCLRLLLVACAHVDLGAMTRQLLDCNEPDS